MTEEKKYELVKFVNGELELEVNVSPKEETIWMTLEHLSLLFDRDKSVISRHIKNIFIEQELNKHSTVAKNAIVQIEGNRQVKRYIEYYNLDVIIAVGYRVNSKMGTKFRKWANKILKEYLLKGYVINENRVIVSNENYIELKNEVVNINNRLLKVEEKVLEKEYGFNKIFFDGQFYDAYTFIQSIFEKANKEIIIIDNYVDRTVLDRLVVKKNNVNTMIYTDINTSRILAKDEKTFNKQYGGLTIIYTTKVHDRYIIIDRCKIYHLGHSIKDLGKKIFSINELENILIKMLLKNL